MSKHTPGPLEVQGPFGLEKLHGKHFFELRSCDGILLATLSYDGWDPECQENALADAKLYAAAPELLEALRRIEQDSEDELSQLCAKAAIAKAEGR